MPYRQRMAARLAAVPDARTRAQQPLKSEMLARSIIHHPAGLDTGCAKTMHHDGAAARWCRTVRCECAVM